MFLWRSTSTDDHYFGCFYGGAPLGSTDASTDAHHFGCSSTDFTFLGAFSGHFSPKISEILSPKISEIISPKISEISRKISEILSPKISEISPKISEILSPKISEILSPKISEIFLTENFMFFPRLSFHSDSDVEWKLDSSGLSTSSCETWESLQTKSSMESPSSLTPWLLCPLPDSSLGSQTLCSLTSPLLPQEEKVESLSWPVSLNT